MTRVRKAAPNWSTVLDDLEGDAHASLSLRVHDALFEAILRGRIAPGSHLAEQPIADRLGVSRIGVREAVRELSRGGLAEIVPNRGGFTATFAPDDIEEIFSLRAALERIAVRLVAKDASRTDLARLEDVVDEMSDVESGHDRLAGARIDTTFHRILMEASGHRRALHAWHAMSAQITMAVYNSTTYYQDIDGLASRHQGIVDTIRTGDPEAAEAFILDHILDGGRLLLEAVRRDRLLDRSDAKPTTELERTT